MKKRYFFLACIFLMQYVAKSQVKIGDNPTQIDSASLLELESTNKGFVLPRVSLVDLGSPFPLSSRLLTGTLVYNINPLMKNGEGAGVYLWRGGSWGLVTAQSLNVGSWSIGGNLGLSLLTSFIGTLDSIDFGIRTDGLERMRVLASGNVGIGTSTPTERLSVLGNFYLNGAFMPGGNGGIAGQVLTSTGPKTAPTWQTPVGGSNGWLLTGNAGTSYATNFLGTTDNVGFRMRTNNIQRILVDSLGSVAIGSEALNANNRERLLVDYGNTTSNTIAAFRGNIADHLKIKVQNTNPGSAATTDIVATASDGTDSTYYVDMGINSKNYNPSPENWGAARDAFLYANSRRLLLGTQASNSDIIFLAGGGKVSLNTVFELSGTTGNIIVGNGDSSSKPTGNVLRGPNGAGANIAGGSLTIQGGSGVGTGSRKP
jgi:hypothetical protein